jgi:hypothetical protein
MSRITPTTAFHNPCTRTTLVALAAAFASGCTSLPALEGGQMVVVSNGHRLNSLDVFSQVDVAYQLDPLNYGDCGAAGTYTHPTAAVGPSMASPSAETTAKQVQAISGDEADRAASRIRCALNGFHSPRYFEKLDDRTRDSLDVSNVAFAYAEKQTNRIAELSRKVDDTISRLDSRFDTQYRTTLRTQLQNAVVTQQLEDLTRRVRQASESAPLMEFQRRRRNSVQSAIISASDAACDQYKRSLNREYSTSNFNFGSFATIAGGLGAAAADGGTSRGLAALAGITSGVRAEYNDAFFRNKVVELLTKAMDISRTRKREEIRRRSAQILADYSVENAIGDSIIYNAQCSLVAGLQETSESLQTVSDPGLKWLANAFGGAASDRDLTTRLFQALGQAVGTVQAIQKSTEDQNAVVASPAAPAASAPN